MISFSVVTPTLNQSLFIEKTIQSVLDQKYTDYEHIVVDGGSGDGTIEILKKYPHLKWRSENDKGRSDALNKGFAQARGDIVAWINSDDYYLPDTFRKVAQFFDDNHDRSILVGRAKVVGPAGDFLFDQEAYPNQELHFEGLLRFWKNRSLPQPSLFFKRQVLDAIGPFSEKLHDYPDYDLVLRMSRKFKMYSVPDFYSCICIQENAGSVLDITNGVLEKKLLSVSLPHWRYLTWQQRIKIHGSYAVYFPWMAWRAHYEKFAFSHKRHLNESWRRQAFWDFLKSNYKLCLQYPWEFLWAGLQFFRKYLRRAREKND